MVEKSSTVSSTQSTRDAFSSPIAKVLLTIVTFLFAGLTAIAVYKHGVWGIIEPHFQAFGPAQVFTDLVIALCLFLVWMWHDAKRNNRNFWLWLVVTLCLGSFGPLLYLISLKRKTAEVR